MHFISIWISKLYWKKNCSIQYCVNCYCSLSINPLGKMSLTSLTGGFQIALVDLTLNCAYVSGTPGWWHGLTSNNYLSSPKRLTFQRVMKVPGVIHLESHIQPSSMSAKGWLPVKENLCLPCLCQTLQKGVRPSRKESTPSQCVLLQFLKWVSSICHFARDERDVKQGVVLQHYLEDCLSTNLRWLFILML